MSRRATSVAAASALLALGVSACGGSSYPVNVQTNFLNACETNGGSVSRCGCTLKAIEANVSLSKFQIAENAIEAGDTNYPSWLLNSVSSCRKD